MTKIVKILKNEKFTQTLLGGGDVEYGHSCRETMFYIRVVILGKLEIYDNLEILGKFEIFPICPIISNLPKLKISNLHVLLITSDMSAKSYSSSKSKVSSKSILLPKVHVCQKCFLMVLPKLTSKSVYNQWDGGVLKSAAGGSRHHSKLVQVVYDRGYTNQWTGPVLAFVKDLSSVLTA